MSCGHKATALRDFLADTRKSSRYSIQRLYEVTAQPAVVEAEPPFTLFTQNGAAGLSRSTVSSSAASPGSAACSGRYQHRENQEESRGGFLHQHRPGGSHPPVGNWGSLPGLGFASLVPASGTGFCTSSQDCPAQDPGTSDPRLGPQHPEEPPIHFWGLRRAFRDSSGEAREPVQTCPTSAR